MSIRNILIILGLFLLALALAFALSNSVLKTGSFFQNTPKATLNNHTFNLIVAKSEKEKQVGLSKHNSLPKDEGMLFPFGKADFYGFWMKNMKFSLDIIYIKDRKVVTIIENAKPAEEGEPEVYRPSETADTVLEINSGLSKEYGIKKGTAVKYENLSN